MARFLKYVFPVSNNAEICALQTLAAAGSLTINGSLSNATHNSASFIQNGYCRTISITSANNLSAVNFTIQGMQNGVAITQVIAGPNNNTVYGTNNWDTITSITTNAAAAGVSLGGGYSGFFAPIILDPYLTGGYNFLISNAGAVDTAIADFNIWASNTDIRLNGYTDLSNIANGNLFEIDTATETDFSFPDVSAPNTYMPIFYSFVFQIAGKAATIGTPITLTFRQS